jgi:hypothetical protein
VKPVTTWSMGLILIGVTGLSSRFFLDGLAVESHSFWVDMRSALWVMVLDYLSGQQLSVVPQSAWAPLQVLLFVVSM